jgi:protein involved in polysaccharide export with SLBB domain
MAAPPPTPHRTTSRSAFLAPDSVALQPGDMVRISVWRKPELSGEFVVAADGSLSHPIYRDVQVAGVPIRVAEQRLSQSLSRFEATPQFVLEPLLRVSVLGEVARPGLFSLRPETSLSQAVALAGGPGDRGRTDRVILRRGGVQHRIDLRGGRVGAAEVPIRSGDEIVVERRRRVFADYIAPVVTVAGGTAAIITAVVRLRGR